MNTDGRTINKLSEAVIGCAFRVSNTLGHGFLEKVYERALVHELAKSGLSILQQHRLEVRYDGVVVGEYTADLIVNEQILVEIKAVEQLRKAYHAQCLNYLKATGLPLALLLNFGRPRVEIARIAGEALQS